VLFTETGHKLLIFKSSQTNEGPVTEMSFHTTFKDVQKSNDLPLTVRNGCWPVYQPLCSSKILINDKAYSVSDYQNPVKFPNLRL